MSSDSRGALATRAPPLILVAENEENHRFILRRVFRTVGFDVRLHFVDDGQEMLDYLERTGAYTTHEAAPWPDLVMVDLHMPRLDGLGALRAMRRSERLRMLPVIIFSSSDQPHHVDQAYASGANAYLVKVGDFDRLVSHLRGMLEFWLQTARLPRPPEGRLDTMPEQLSGRTDA